MNLVQICINENFAAAFKPGHKSNNEDQNVTSKTKYLTLSLLSAFDLPVFFIPQSQSAIAARSPRENNTFTSNNCHMGGTTAH